MKQSLIIGKWEVYGWLMGIEWGNIGIYTYIYNILVSYNDFTTMFKRNHHLNMKLFEVLEVF